MSKYVFLILFSVISFNCSNQVIQNTEVKREKLICLTDLVNIRKLPTIKSDILGQINSGTIIDIISPETINDTVNNITGVRYKVKMENTEGYVFGHYFSKYSDETFIDSDYFGKAFIIKDKTILKKFNYTSFSMLDRKAQENGEKVALGYSTNNEVCIYGDKYLDFMEVSGELHTDNCVKTSKIYNKSGKLIYSGKERSFNVTNSSDNLGILFYNYIDDIEVYYSNRLLIINQKGEKVYDDKIMQKLKNDKIIPIPFHNYKYLVCATSENVCYIDLNDGTKILKPIIYSKDETAMIKTKQLNSISVYDKNILRILVNKGTSSETEIIKEIERI